MPRSKMTAQEKADNKAVRDYLDALVTNAPKRGRKRTTDNVKARISAIGEAMGNASATKRLDLVQERLDLEAELDAMARAGSVDMGGLEAGFVKSAASYGSGRGISYAAWREMGVSATTLKSAGIRRTRRS
ncbi:MAG: hypothetical protein MKZ66_06700 [Acidimicrobiales bacterium]|nr:hypothetical protein [Acidimicrobiales bacterium]